MPSEEEAMRAAEQLGEAAQHQFEEALRLMVKSVGEDLRRDMQELDGQREELR